MTLGPAWPPHDNTRTSLIWLKLLYVGTDDTNSAPVLKKDALKDVVEKFNWNCIWWEICGSRTKLMRHCSHNVDIIMTWRFCLKDMVSNILRLFPYPQCRSECVDKGLYCEFVTEQLSHKSYQWGTHRTSYTSLMKRLIKFQIWVKTVFYLLSAYSTEQWNQTQYQQKYKRRWLRHRLKNSISYVVICPLRETIPKDLKGCLSFKAPMLNRIYRYMAIQHLFKENY